MKNCYSAGKVTASGGSLSYAIDRDAKTIENCVALEGSGQMQTTGGSNKVTSLTSDQLKYWAVPFALNGKRLKGAWTLDAKSANGGYPVLGTDKLRAAADWSEVAQGVDAGLISSKPKGDGSATVAGDAGPFQITDAEQLAWFAHQVNNGLAADKQNAKMTAGADLAGGAYTGKTGPGTDYKDCLPWVPIGNSLSIVFGGTFDGGGAGASNLYVSGDGLIGLFGIVDGATVKNVGVDSGFVKSTSTDAGGLIGRAANAASTVSGCWNGATVDAPGNAGGVVGNVYGASSTLIEKCWNTGTVYQFVKTTAGGVVGNIQSGSPTVKNCYNAGAITGISQVGGVVGSYTGSGCAIESCYNVGEVKKAASGGSNGAIIATDGGAVTVDNCFYLEGSAPNATVVAGTARTDAQMKSWKTAYLLNGKKYVGSTDGAQPASTTWTSSASANGGYPSFGNLVAAKLTVELDPASLAKKGSDGTVAAKFKDAKGAEKKLSGKVELTRKLHDVTAGTTLEDVGTAKAAFATRGTLNANKHVALSLGGTSLSATLPVGQVMAANGAEDMALAVGAAYTHAADRTVKFDVVDDAGGYEVTATVKAVASKKLDVTLPAEAASSFALTPDGKVHAGDGAAKSGALSLTSNSSVPVAGKVSSVAPLKVGTETAFKQMVNAVVNPTGKATTLAPNKNPVTQDGQAKLYVAASGADASLTKLDAPCYYDPSTKDVPLWFAMPGTKKVAWKWGLDYTGTHAGAAGVFGYSTGFTLGLPEQDVPAPVLSGTEIDMVTAGVTASATA